eukprot:gnl/Hemi2/8917_TR3088_c0_g1_i1.p1 gnl/Hemi2/8917_TR3088_c0_g1~~gnl/Hemi2/8917_TR3088_c0_g1_i1.p1  ORF type:complete len:359 (+),score=46.03 gnl/Hemi2/8917_TR3088_c0_g1_i1:381-1457(+)
MRWIAGLQDICTNSKYDLVVCGNVRPTFAAMLKEKHPGLPLVYATDTPIFPTTAMGPPSQASRLQTSPSLYYRAKWHKHAWDEFSQFGEIFNHTRRDVFDLPPVTMASYVKDTFHRFDTLPVLNMFSERLIARPKDWPANHVVTGPCIVGPDTNYTPDPRITDWLKAGPPPVFFGYGMVSASSMPKKARVDHFASFRHSIMNASEELDIRARGVIFTRGFEDVGGAHTGFGLHQQLLYVPHLPEWWLLPKCQGAVVDGNSTTLQHVLRCGLPTLVLPPGPQAPSHQLWGVAAEAQGVAQVKQRYQMTTLVIGGIVQSMYTDSRKKWVDKAKKLATQLQEEEDGAVKAATTALKLVNLS